MLKFVKPKDTRLEITNNYQLIGSLETDDEIVNVFAFEENGLAFRNLIKLVENEEQQ